MQNSSSSGGRAFDPLSRSVPGIAGAGMPGRSARLAPLLTPAARKATRQRMLMLRQSALDRIVSLTGIRAAELKRYRHELGESELPDLLIQRGAGLPFARELPQGSLLYLLVRALRPQRIVETGVRPGYSTSWILEALKSNSEGELVSLGPGPTAGRSSGVQDVSVGQFVPPGLRARWTLELGNTEERLAGILANRPADLFLYDNGPDVNRARYELRTAWANLSSRGILLAHHVDANTAWTEFCRLQGLSAQLLDPGPPPMGALGMRPERV